MVQFGESFDYNGRNSKEFDIQIVRIDNLDVPLGLTREISKGSTNFYKNRADHYGTSYSDVLAFEIHIIKNTCDNDSSFSKNDIRTINAWLTSPTTPKKLHMYNFENEDEEEYDYYGLFTDIRYEFTNVGDNGKPAAIIASFICDSPFGWVTKNQEIEVTTDTIATIVVDSDEWENYIYPLIKVETDNVIGATSRIFSIENTSDNNRKFEITISDNNTFWIDSEKLTIYDEIGLIDLDSLNISDEGYIYLPRLINGNNNFILSGNCTVTFTWKEPRKTGAW